MKVRFTPLALAEIGRILEELAIQSPRGARNVQNRLRWATSSVGEHPHIGQLTDTPPVRRLVLQPYPYILFYRTAETEVVVIGLRHAARDPSTMPGAGEADG